MRRALTTALCAAALATATGCGGGGGGRSATDPGQGARAAAQSYVDARNRGDAAKVCQLYSQRLINQLAASDCEDFVRQQTSGASTKFQLGGIQESGDHATATLQSTGESGKPAQLQIQLQRQNGVWKISSLGP